MISISEITKLCLVDDTDLSKHKSLEITSKRRLTREMQDSPKICEQLSVAGRFEKFPCPVSNNPKSRLSFLTYFPIESPLRYPTLAELSSSGRNQGEGARFQAIFEDAAGSSLLTARTNFDNEARNVHRGWKNSRGRLRQRIRNKVRELVARRRYRTILLHGASPVRIYERQHR